ncbi:MAG TPA: D-2-hydroxyacid dehydrogenase [Steroidobacteraceae bacterium]|jgi:glycerate dehydrogenase
MKAVFLDFDTVSAHDLDTSRLAASVDELVLHPIDEARVPEMLEGADVAFLNKVKLGRTLLTGAKKLRLVALAATGTDNVDLAAARELGIAVCNVRAYCTASVVQHVWALILSLNQHVLQYSRMTSNGTWTRDESSTVLSHPIRELAGRIFGVVGYGELGRGTARVAEAFGMRVLVANRPGTPLAPGRVPLEQLLAESDIISLHCPLTEATRGLIGSAEIKLMKKEALLVNTARGGLIDGVALAAALRERRLGGAGLDVLGREPPPIDDPLLDPEIPNLLVTPHVAWAAREARQRCIDEMAANVRDFRSGGRRGRVV